jgi:hypothetical protein
VSSLPTCYITYYYCDLFITDDTTDTRPICITTEHAIIIMTSSTGKMMNAVRFHGKEDLRYERVPEPECGKGQIKIKPAWCGICGRVCIRPARRPEGETRRTDVAEIVCDSNTDSISFLSRCYPTNTLPQRPPRIPRRPVALPDHTTPHHRRDDPVDVRARVQRDDSRSRGRGFGQLRGWRSGLRAAHYLRWDLRVVRGGSRQLLR